MVTKAKIKRAVSAYLKDSKTDKLYHNLTVNCFKMPAKLLDSAVGGNGRKTN